MRVLLWHVHGSYTTAFVQGDHDYFVPVEPERGPDGRGRAETYPWPDTVVEVDQATCAGLDVDVVVLQRPHELHSLARAWLGGREPGRDIPAIYLEHNTPPSLTGDCRHPAADRDGVVVAHVTYSNALFWDTGATPTRVIEHGIVDPGPRYQGDEERLVVVINDPARRGRVTGTDLLARFAQAAPVDLFGMNAALVGGVDDVGQDKLHDEMARRRAYVHTSRWTSLGLSLLEAMHLGMPVVALATAEVPRAVPKECGFVSNNLDELIDGCRLLIADHDLAVEMGRRAREHARRQYGLERFLADWDRLFDEVTA